MAGILPRNAERKTPKSSSVCYHSAGEEPPGPYRDNGPIEGTKQYLASLCACSRADRRSLDSLVKDGLSGDNVYITAFTGFGSGSRAIFSRQGKPPVIIAGVAKTESSLLYAAVAFARRAWSSLRSLPWL